MLNKLKIAMYLIGIFILILALRFMNIQIETFFRPLEMNVNYSATLNSREWTEATIRQLYQYKLQYLKASSEEKLGIRALIIHDTSGYDIGRLPSDLIVFIESLRNM